MAHVRQEIRDAAVNTLKGLPTTGDRVFSNRVNPVDEDHLPAILVFTLAEASEPDVMAEPGERTLTRDLAVMVDVYARKKDGVADDLDAICADIEEALSESGKLGGLVMDMYLSETQVSLDFAGDQPHASASMTWAMQYRTADNDAEQAL